jgi:CheY-like chemotaxis protein
MQSAERPSDDGRAAASTGGPGSSRPGPGLDESQRKPGSWAETVLVVDDDDAVRKLMCRVLELQGFEVLEAPDGASALDLVRTMEGEPDLAVCDINMPGISGGKLVGELAAMRPRLTFVYVSGYRVESPRSLTLSDGAGRPIPFLPKPFSPTDLVLAVRGALDRRRITRG